MIQQVDGYQRTKDKLPTFEELKDCGIISTTSKDDNFISIIKQEYNELVYSNLFFLF